MSFEFDLRIRFYKVLYCTTVLLTTKTLFIVLKSNYCTVLRESANSEHHLDFLTYRIYL